ncbi:nucleotidyltransferase family protein [Murdochiella vaginalis]|uniref:nucleotidyltransferase family protein n=1 Tax=Murdochiella vaginalis TaxID=1852373 RepID=UPI0008FE9AEE|nr:nucleotidyltransferase family protein [Murdochiella vaginalis]
MRTSPYNACGIICEANPLHAGHVRLIQQAKKQYSTIVAAMSGAFMQRGTPGFVDKWSRAQFLLRHGVDLVIEIPQAYVLQNADLFARGGVEALSGIPAVSALAFGVEEQANASIRPLQSDAVQQEIRRLLQSGSAYRRAVEIASGGLSLPNQILAVQYEKAMRDLHLSWRTLRLSRPALDAEKSPSATALRHDLQEAMEKMNGDTSPERLLSILQNDNRFSGLEEKENLVRCRLGESLEPLLPLCRALLLLDKLPLSRSPQYEEGMDRRFLKALQNAATMEEAFSFASNKRQSKARYRRLVLTTLLGIEKFSLVHIDYVRPLAFNTSGAKLLREVRLPVYQKTPAAKERTFSPLFLIDQKAQRLYEWLKGLENLDLLQTFYHTH